MATTYAIERFRAEVGALVARHEQTRDLASFAKYADDPAGFMRDVLRCEPWSKQVEMAERVRDNPRVVCVTSNGIGKDWVTARIALWWVFARRGFVVLTGPTERQVKNILMREVRRAFSKAPELPGELYALELRADATSECGILAFTSDNADKLTGFHHPRLLVCMTEGQGVEDEAYEAAQACCTSPGNRLFVYGNPTRPTGAFYRAAQSDHWNTLTIPASSHPNVVTGREEIPGAVSRDWIESMREEYGEGSSIYMARVLARFPEESLEGLVKREWLRAAFDRHSEGAIAVAGGRYPTLLAVDVARFGPDSSAIAVLKGPLVERMITWRGTSITETADRVIACANEVSHFGATPRPKIMVDEPGLGGGVIDVLRSKGWRTLAFNGAAAAPDSRRFLNMRAASHWQFRELLENQQVILPRDSALEEEALAVEWQLTTSGHIQVVAKDLVRKAIGRSPDRLDAVVMGLTETMPGFRPRMTYGSSVYVQ